MPSLDVDVSLFVSYARIDEATVRPIASLIAAALDDGSAQDWPRRELLFLDTTSLRPGFDWREQIDAALQRCAKLFVFWCEHASTSNEVQREVQAAQRLGKVVVPVLLDSAPLAETLRKVHAVDLRSMGLHRVGPPPDPRYLRAQAAASRYAVALADAFAGSLDVDAGPLSKRIQARLALNIV